MELFSPTFVASSDGVRVAWYDLGGSKDATAPVLFFSHATGFHGQIWGPLASCLGDTYRCVALDYRGHGHSTAPERLGSLAWTHLADDALAVLDSLGVDGIPVHGVGHSMGGAALTLAEARRPGTFQSLWLYEPVIAPPDGSFSPDGENPMADGASKRRTEFASYDEAFANFASKPPLNQLHPDALRAYVEGGFAPADNHVVLRCAPSTEAEVFRRALQSGTWDVLDRVKTPVAVVAGRAEGMGPVAFAPAVAAALPNGSMLERRDLGHFGPLEDPASMARDLKEWVESHS